MVTIDAFDIAAFVVFAVLLAAVVVIVVVLGSLPGKIAAQRNHPQAAAVAAAGWVSLATVFALWPIAFVWAFMQPRPSTAPDSGATKP
jgi:Protein of unknown function (DUF3302)